MTIEEVIEQFPVTREQIKAVFEFAALNLDAPRDRGWDRLKNGDLLDAAEADGFDVSESGEPNSHELEPASSSPLRRWHRVESAAMTAKRLLIPVCVASLVGVASLAAQNSIPTPPVKPGLWETRMSQLDANGQEVPSPEFAALSKMPPEQREKMAEAMRARGVQLPDANGTMKACLSKESLDSGAWQQLAAQSGCVTTFSTRTNSAWKWHTACASLHSESDGETAFNGSESYRTKVTTTSTMAGKTRTTTRIVQGKWIGAACGDIKPLTPPPSGRGR